MRKFVFFCMALTVLMFASVSCIHESPNINFNQTTIHNADFSGIMEAIKSQTTSLEDKLALIGDAISAQNLTIAQKFDLLEEAVNRGVISLKEQSEQMTNAIKYAIASLENSTKDKLAALDTAMAETRIALSDKLGALTFAVENQTIDVKNQIDLLEKAVTKTMDDQTRKMEDKLKELKDALKLSIDNVEQQLGLLTGAVNSQTVELKDKIELVEKAVKKGFEDEVAEMNLYKQAVMACFDNQNKTLEEKLQAVTDAIKAAGNNVTEKLGLIEGTVNAHGLALAEKLGFIDTAIKNGFTDEASEIELLKQAVVSSLDDQSKEMGEKIAAFQQALESVGEDITKRLGLIKGAVYSQTFALADKLSLIEETVKNGYINESQQIELLREGVKNSIEDQTKTEEEIAGLLDEIRKNLNNGFTNITSKLALVEGAVEAQTLAFDVKLALLNDILKEGFANEEQQLALMRVAITSALQAQSMMENYNFRQITEAIRDFDASNEEKLEMIETAIKSLNEKSIEQLKLIVAAIQDGFKAEGEILVNLQKAVIKSLNDQTASIDSTSKAISEAITALDGSLAAQTEVVKAGMLSIDADLKGVGKEIDELDAALDQALDDVDASLKGIRTDLQTLDKDTKEKIEAVVSAITTADTNNSAKLALIETAIEALDGSLDAQIIALTQAITKGFNKESDLIEELGTTLGQAISTQGTNLTNEIKDLSGKVGAMTTAIGAMDDNLKGQLELVNTAMGTIADNINNSLKNVADKIDTSSARLDSIKLKVAAVVTAIAEAETSNASKLELIESAINTLNTSVTNLDASLDLQIAALTEALKKGFADQGALITKLGEAIGTAISTQGGKLEAEMQKMTGAVGDLSKAIGALDKNVNDQLALVNTAMGKISESINNSLKNVADKIDTSSARLDSIKLKVAAVVDAIAAAETSNASKLALIESAINTLNTSVTNLDASLDLQIAALTEALKKGFADQGALITELGTTLGQAISTQGGKLEAEMQNMTGAVGALTTAIGTLDGSLDAQLLLIKSAIDKIAVKLDTSNVRQDSIRAKIEAVAVAIMKSQTDDADKLKMISDAITTLGTNTNAQLALIIKAIDEAKTAVSGGFTKQSELITALSNMLSGKLDALTGALDGLEGLSDKLDLIDKTLGKIQLEIDSVGKGVDTLNLHIKKELKTATAAIVASQGTISDKLVELGTALGTLNTSVGNVGTAVGNVKTSLEAQTVVLQTGFKNLADTLRKSDKALEEKAQAIATAIGAIDLSVIPDYSETLAAIQAALVGEGDVPTKLAAIEAAIKGTVIEDVDITYNDAHTEAYMSGGAWERGKKDPKFVTEVTENLEFTIPGVINGEASLLRKAVILEKSTMPNIKVTAKYGKKDDNLWTVTVDDSKLSYNTPSFLIEEQKEGMMTQVVVRRYAKQYTVNVSSSEHWNISKVSLKDSLHNVSTPMANLKSFDVSFSASKMNAEIDITNFVEVRYSTGDLYMARINKEAWEFISQKGTAEQNAAAIDSLNKALTSAPASVTVANEAAAANVTVPTVYWTKKNADDAVTYTSATQGSTYFWVRAALDNDSIFTAYPETVTLNFQEPESFKALENLSSEVENAYGEAATQTGYAVTVNVKGEYPILSAADAAQVSVAQTHLINYAEDGLSATAAAAAYDELQPDDKAEADRQMLAALKYSAIEFEKSTVTTASKPAIHWSNSGDNQSAYKLDTIQGSADGQQLVSAGTGTLTFSKYPTSMKVKASITERGNYYVRSEYPAETFTTETEFVVSVAENATAIVKSAMLPLVTFSEENTVATVTPQKLYTDSVEQIGNILNTTALDTSNVVLNAPDRETIVTTPTIDWKNTVDGSGYSVTGAKPMPEVGHFIIKTTGEDKYEFRKYSKKYSVEATANDGWGIISDVYYAGKEINDENKKHIIDIPIEVEVSGNSKNDSTYSGSAAYISGVPVKLVTFSDDNKLATVKADVYNNPTLKPLAFAIINEQIEMSDPLVAAEVRADGNVNVPTIGYKTDGNVKVSGEKVGETAHLVLLSSGEETYTIAQYPAEYKVIAALDEEKNLPAFTVVDGSYYGVDNDTQSLINGGTSTFNAQITLISGVPDNTTAISYSKKAGFFDVKALTLLTISEDRSEAEVSEKVMSSVTYKKMALDTINDKDKGLLLSEPVFVPGDRSVCEIPTIRYKKDDNTEISLGGPVEQEEGSFLVRTALRQKSDVYYYTYQLFSKQYTVYYGLIDGLEGYALKAFYKNVYNETTDRERTPENGVITIDFFNNISYNNTTFEYSGLKVNYSAYVEASAIKLVTFENDNTVAVVPASVRNDATLWAAAQDILKEGLVVSDVNLTPAVRSSVSVPTVQYTQGNSTSVSGDTIHGTPRIVLAGTEGEEGAKVYKYQLYPEKFKVTVQLTGSEGNPDNWYLATDYFNAGATDAGTNTENGTQFELELFPSTGYNASDYTYSCNAANVVTQARQVVTFDSDHKLATVSDTVYSNGTLWARAQAIILSEGGLNVSDVTVESKERGINKLSVPTIRFQQGDNTSITIPMTAVTTSEKKLVKTNTTAPYTFKLFYSQYTTTIAKSGDGVLVATQYDAGSEDDKAPEAGAITFDLFPDGTYTPATFVYLATPAYVTTRRVDIPASLTFNSPYNTEAYYTVSDQSSSSNRLSDLNATIKTILESGELKVSTNGILKNQTRPRSAQNTPAVYWQGTNATVELESTSGSFIVVSCEITRTGTSSNRRYSYKYTFTKYPETVKVAISTDKDMEQYFWANQKYDLGSSTPQNFSEGGTVEFNLKPNGYDYTKFAPSFSGSSSPQSKYHYSQLPPYLNAEVFVDIASIVRNENNRTYVAKKYVNESSEDKILAYIKEHASSYSFSDSYSQLLTKTTSNPASVSVPTIVYPADKSRELRYQIDFSKAEGATAYYEFATSQQNDDDYLVKVGYDKYDITVTQETCNKGSLTFLDTWSASGTFTYTLSDAAGNSNGDSGSSSSTKITVTFSESNLKATLNCTKK